MSISDQVALIHRVNEAGLSLFKDAQALAASYPTWPSNDIRLTVFAKCSSVLENTSLGMNFIFLHLADDDWWQSKADERIPADQIRAKVGAFDTFIKIAFFHLFFSAVESSFRLIVRAIDANACEGGKSDFKNIYAWLLSRFKLQGWEPLLDLMRCVRNTIHNNGIFFPRSGKNEEIQYNGASYSFVVGTPISATWSFLLDLVADTERMLLDVMKNTDVTAQQAIVDPLTR